MGAVMSEEETRWRKGQRVTVAGLNNRAELNGCVGTVRRWVAEQERYEVNLDGQRIGVRAANLVAVVDSAGTEESAAGGNLTTEGDSEARECRCMFCGELIVCKSEDEAIIHMQTCPALGEQLAGKQQFTIPKDTIPS